jgi:hypothetical protein
MQTNRLEAFSDGVLAIIITIMMLELKVPRGVDLAALLPVLPVFASYPTHKAEPSSQTDTRVGQTIAFCRLSSSLGH